MHFRYFFTLTVFSEPITDNMSFPFQIFGKILTQPKTKCAHSMLYCLLGFLGIVVKHKIDKQRSEKTMYHSLIDLAFS